MDELLYSEHRLNLWHKDNTNNFKQMFQREVACKAISAHNVHHGVSRVQERGTGIVAFGDTTGYVSKVGRDPYGLGRWCWTVYGGSEGHCTRVIVAYNALQKQQERLKNNVPTATSVFHHKEEGFDTPPKVVLATPIKATSKMADSRKLNYPIHAPQ